VHAAAAIWGLLSVGLFADSTLPGIEVKDGLFHRGDLELLGLQFWGIVVIAAWGAALVTPFFYLVGVLLGGSWNNPRIRLRVPEESELEGIDQSIHRSARSLKVDKDTSTSSDDPSSTCPDSIVGKASRPSLAHAPVYSKHRYCNATSNRLDVVPDTNEPTQEATEESDAGKDNLCNEQHEDTNEGV
jgi:hypothetical protein